MAEALRWLGARTEFYLPEKGKGRAKVLPNPLALQFPKEISWLVEAAC